MASGKGNDRADDTLDWLLETGTPTRPGSVNNIRIALCTTTNPSASSPATGLTGTGYSAGGELITFGAAASQQAQGPSSAIQWTNGSGGDWTITGAVLHDAGTAHPTAADLIYFDDAFDVVVPNGATLEIAINGVTVTEA